MSDPVWLGIDLGTQSVRALAADAQGAVLAFASAPLASFHDGVRHTQRPEDWWAAVCTCCRQVTAALHGRVVSALSIDATSGTVLLLDENLHPASEALMYGDARAVDESTEINCKGETFWAEMGYRTQATWALPKILWLARHCPESFTSGCVAHQNDYIHARLAGRMLPTDWSHALKSGFDLLRTGWPITLFTNLGLSDRHFPGVVSPGTVIGTISSEGARSTGLPSGCPIVSGMTDGCASQIAAGAVQHGDWNAVLGTTLVVKGASRKRVTDPLGVVYCHRSAQGTWLPGGASSAGAGVLTRLFPSADLNELGRAASALPRLEAVTYPLAGTGERFPFIAPQAQSFTIGSPHGQVEEFAAALVGVACVERLCFDYMRMLGAPVHGRISITGGGVQSAFWNHLRSDLLGTPLHIPASPEAAFGAATLAASHSNSLEAAVSAMVHPREVVHPDASRARHLIELYRRFVGALEQRGWLPQHVADFARVRATA